MVPVSLDRLHMANPKSSSIRAPLTPDDVMLVARMVQRIRAGGDLRRLMIRRVRSAIRSGEYENSLKVEIAAGRVVEELSLPEKQNANG